MIAPDMCMADIKNGAITIEGLDALDKKLTQLKTDNPGFEKRLRDVIRKILGEARANLRADAASGLDMESDPRKAYKAVRFAVYKKIFGGQVNILSPRKAGAMNLYEPPRKGTKDPYGRGGNRMKRSARTTDMMSYQGSDRWMVLQWLNNGTRDRYSGSGRNGKTLSQYNAFVERTGGRGKRGHITARNWFGPRSYQELQTVAGEMEALIDKIIKDEFK